MEGIMAIARDIREKVVRAIEGGLSRRQAAARFAIDPATAVRWAKRVELTREVAPFKMGGDRRSQRIEAHADFILAQIEEKPDLTIMELRETIRERRGLSFGYGTVWRFLARHGITRKNRKKTGRASERERESPQLSARRGLRTARSRSLETPVHRRNAISTNGARFTRSAPDSARRRASVPFGAYGDRRRVDRPPSQPAYSRFWRRRFPQARWA
jgi:transposase